MKLNPVLIAPLFLCLVTGFSANAQSKPKDTRPPIQAGPMGQNPYIKMCIDTANQKGHYGDGDLGGNPKLAAYCECFGQKFMARALKTSSQPASAQPSLEQTVKEELAMRNSCRAANGLPEVPAKLR